VERSGAELRLKHPFRSNTVAGLRGDWSPTQLRAGVARELGCPILVLILVTLLII
jgi:hypothetical protein